MLYSVNGYAQNMQQDSLIFDKNLLSKKMNDDIRIPIIKILGNHLNQDALFKTPKNTSFLFSIAFHVNKNGKIEAITLPDHISSKILSIVNPDQSLVLKFKEISNIDKKYNDKVLILLVLFKRPEDNSIHNLNEFLNDYVNIWPKLEKINPLNKPVVFLQPYINDYFDPIR